MITITINGHEKEGKITQHKLESNSNNYLTLLLLFAAIAEIQKGDEKLTAKLQEWHQREAHRLSELGIDKQDLRGEDEQIPRKTVPGVVEGGGSVDPSMLLKEAETKIKAAQEKFNTADAAAKQASEALKSADGELKAAQEAKVALSK